MRGKAQVVGLAGVILMCGCAGLLHVFSQLTPPRVRLRDVEVVERPQPHELEAALCPRVVSDGPPSPGATNPTCARLAGPLPRTSPSLTFDLALEVENQNYTALPITEILVGIDLFPDRAAPWAGVSCMALCPSNDPYCWTAGDQRPCEGARQGVPRERDYTGARLDLITARGVLIDHGQRPRQEQLTVPARTKMLVVARFGFVPGAMVEVLTASARRGGAALRQGQPPPLSLPFEIDGAVYMTARSGETLAQAFGPVRGTWSLGGAVAARDDRQKEIGP